MKGDLIDLLVCPVCQAGSLEMHVRDRRVQEIIDADLTCPRCGRSYPVTEGIPVMLSYADGQQQRSETLRSPSQKHNEVREANIAYYDAVAEIYEDEVEQAIHQSDSNQTRVETIVKDLAEKTPNNLFLDLGCGTGNILKLGSKHFKRAIGVDISFNMLRMARQSNLDVVQADVLSLPFKPSIFDAVSIFSVLHHIYDYHLVFDQIGRVLKNGGYLYSDWDPAKKPLPENRGISWGVYQLANNLYSLLRMAKGKLKLIIKWDRSKTDAVDFMKIRPDLRETQAKAEFHNITPVEQRGIDFPEVKNRLLLRGFGDVQAFYHESGLTLNQLSGIPFLRSKLLAFLGFDPEPFMENILILARKKENSPENISSACLENCEKK